MNEKEIKKLIEIEKLARILMDQIYKMDSDKQYATAFVLLKVHGIKYTGPTIYSEGAALNSALSELKALRKKI